MEIEFILTRIANAPYCRIVLVSFFCRIAVHEKWRMLFNFVTYCDEVHSWEERDKSLLPATGIRTPPLRATCARPDNELRGTAGGGVRMLLMQRKAIWVKIEEVFNTVNGQILQEKVYSMVGGISAIRVGLCTRSMSQLAI